MIAKVIRYCTKNVSNVRAFGHLLGIDQGKLNEIIKSPRSANINALSEIVRVWFKMFPMSDADRWEELGRVLAVLERRIACGLQPHLRRGSSVDSAISVFSHQSSIDSPPSYSHFEPSYIRK